MLFCAEIAKFFIIVLLPLIHHCKPYNLMIYFRVITGNGLMVVHLFITMNGIVQRHFLR